MRENSEKYKKRQRGKEIYGSVAQNVGKYFVYYFRLQFVVTAWGVVL